MRREDFLTKVKATNTKTVFIKSLDCEVTLRKLTADYVLKLNADFSDGKITQEEMTFLLITASMIDENGQELLTIQEVKDNLDVSALAELAEVVAEINGMSVEKAKDNLKKI